MPAHEHFKKGRRKMETIKDVELLDNDATIQITGGDWVDFGLGVLCALACIAL